MKNFEISNKYFTVTATVDFHIWNSLNLQKYKWYIQFSGNNISIYTHIMENGRSKQQFLHRLITKCPKNKVVDHINGNGLDNTLTNLRICTRKQNNLNIGRSNKDYSSRYIGVTWDGRLQLKPWRAVASFKNKSINLGYFASEIEAAKARDKFVLKKRGKYARLNFKENK